MDDNKGKYYTDEPIGEAHGGMLPQDGQKDMWDYIEGDDNSGIHNVPWQQPYAGGDSDQAPEPIRRLVAMFSEMPWSLTRNKAFYLQAKAMADYDDQADIVPFSAYYPVFRDMTIGQLRSYFTVRHWLRQGRHPDVPLSYLFVYVYELLMLIGTDTPENAFQMLEELHDAYADSDPKLTKYLKTWMRDFIVYYGLNDHIKDYFAQEIADDTDAIVLSNYAKADDKLLFETAVKTSTYHIKDAVLYKKAPADTAVVCGRAFRAVAPIVEKRIHHRIDKLCLGFRRREYYPMFAEAVYYNPQPVRKAVVNISPRRAFVCMSGLWERDTFVPDILFRRGEFIGKIFRETDRQLRLALNVKPKLRVALDIPGLEPVIRSVVDGYLREKEEAARPKVSVDLSKLDGIRQDAAIVREALLSDDERGDGLPDKPESLREPEEAPSSPSSLTPQERQFVGLLLNGGDWASFLRAIHTPAGVITDSINEKMMDTLGDLVIEDDGNGPTIIADYQEDMRKQI